MKEPVRAGVWRRAAWDWAYKFQTPRGPVFGCGFRNRAEARRARQQAEAKYAEMIDPSEHLTKGQKWYRSQKERDPEYAARAQRKHYEKNRQKILERQRERRKNNPEYERERRRRYDTASRRASSAERHRRRRLSRDADAYDYALVLRGDPCCYCGTRPESGFLKTIDHIIPSEHGGSNEWDNLTSACRSCNSRKHTAPLLLAMLDLTI